MAATIAASRAEHEAMLRGEVPSTVDSGGASSSSGMPPPPAAIVPPLRGRTASGAAVQREDIAGGVVVEPFFKESSSAQGVKEQWELATLAYCHCCRLYWKGKTAAINEGTCGNCNKVMQYAMDYPESDRNYVPWKPWDESEEREKEDSLPPLE